MTREEAWREYNSKPMTTLESDCDVFAAGWDAAINSYKYLLNEAPNFGADNIPYTKIINEMNEILGKTFKTAETHKRHIRARWNEGMREPDFAKVCRTKRDQWDHDPKMRPFLRPETLFGTKMDGYLNEEGKTRATIEEWQ
jgi:uncharacterized phage protein (TIGR02220 family)